MSVLYAVVTVLNSHDWTELKKKRVKNLAEQPDIGSGLKLFVIPLQYAQCVLEAQDGSACVQTLKLFRL